MDIQQARRIIRNTFESSFDKIKFIDFIKDLLNQYDESKAFHLHGCYIPKAFKNFIKTYERIGTYIDLEGKKIDIIIVYLKKETTIDRARTAQRNFIARYLKERGEKDAGLIAFVSPQEEDWRFSFVKMEYKFEKTRKGDVKVKEEFTPARRYSFLVGKNESSHTAQSCFVDILMNDTYNLKLNEIEEAFNIEKVTKEFYEKYRNLFFQVKDALDAIVIKDEEIRKEFQDKGVNIVDFSKKLLGQIVFLYFLQKKGWFGVKKDQKWGSGSKHFLRELFEKKHCDYRNFFNDVLEPLFYEALRNDRSYDDHYFSYFKCKIPFLNGGLFDPLNNYNWAKTDILLADTLFSNQIKTKEGDIGTGILDVFDRYNFTVKEDEPLEKEVAVDPEMLGKVFENLLEVKDRKSKGTYYTPREIVHYMCQQSLINYLYKEVNSEQKSRIKEEKIQMKLLGKPDPIQQSLTIEKDSNIISKEDIEKLIKYGDTTIENENQVVTKGQETKTYSFKLPENIRKNAEIIDEALKNIRVCDPAIGSGAFPVGMMNEIIRARNALTPYLLSRRDFLNQLSKQSHSSAVILNGSEESRTMYNFKRHAIQSSLYGVDIDSGACEIAKLRLWLSLIVDEEDIKHIKPLPNLDYKIVCGNSLLGVERNLENWKLFAKLEELKPLFFNETNTTKKQDYKIQIDELISEITNGHKDFDFEVYFSEVFHEKNGFDVVIANPPYLGFQGIDRSFKKLLQKLYMSTSGKYDLYVPFIEKGFYLLRRNGFFAFICPTAFTKRDYGNKIRKFLLENTQLLELVDFEHTQIFTEATNYTGVFSFIKANLEHNKLKYKTGLSNKLIEILQEQLSESPWIFRDSEAEQIISKIGNNIKLNEISIISEGIVTGLNELYLKSEEELSLKQFECDCFYPCYRGKEIDRYHLKSNSEFVFYPYELVDNKTIPFDEKYLRQRCSNYIAYLQENIQLIRKREYFINSNKKWYELWNQRNLSNFTTSKIITPELSDRNRFAIVSTNTYYGDTVCGIRIKDKYKNRIKLKYLLAVLNSELIEWFYKKTTVPKAGGFFIYKVMYLKNIPLKEISIDNQKPFINLVNEILAITKDDDYFVNFEKQSKVHNYERQIDEMVYKLYNLTPEEIKLVEGFKKNKKI
ncbi:MAG: Eco57I restriction-modification methylase domain-containing protein [Actinomycetia bacterium]|nr:Eco57I restriction-modification methylase domain-containing protein [Actinomycetes bacterium]